MKNIILFGKLSGVIVIAFIMIEIIDFKVNGFFFDFIFPCLLIIFGAYFLYMAAINIWADRIYKCAESGDIINAQRQLKIFSRFPLSRQMRSWSIYYTGELFFMLREFNRSLQYYEKGVKFNKKYSWFYVLYGRICIAERKIEEAVESFEKSLSLKPVQNAAVHDLVYCYTYKDDLKKAVVYHQKINDVPIRESEEIVNTLRMKLEEELNNGN